MSRAGRAEARGVITIVQEGRFRLVTGEGEGLLLTLAHDAAASPRDLCAWQAAATPVVVEYSGEPNLESGVAQRVSAERRTR